MATTAVLKNVFPGATTYPVRWWGFPNINSPRRIKPTVLMVVHITGNSNLPSAIGEAQYSNRDGSGASFTFVNNRDGSTVQCLDPVYHVPWTNGDMNGPNTSLPQVKGMVGSPYNPNEFCFLTVENVGYNPGYPITTAQVDKLAELAAWGSKLSGLPVTRSTARATVLGHRDINSVTRLNCPTPGDLDAFLAQIIHKANAILNPAPAGEVDMPLPHPPTWIPLTGSVGLPADKTFNAFQLVGFDTSGAPVLKRYNGLAFGGSAAQAIARAHWEANKPEEECYLVSPWVYIPGVGWKDQVWWSKSPLPEPAFTAVSSGPTAAEVAALVKQGRQAGARDTAKVAADYAAQQ